MAAGSAATAYGRKVRPELWVPFGWARTKERGVDMPLVRKILLVLFVGFVLFYLIRRPESAAGAARTIFGAISAAFRAIVVFFNSLAG